MDETPNFAGYRAKSPRSPGRQLSLRGIYRALRKQVLYGAWSFPYGTFRQRQLLRSCSRTDRHTYTCFLRAPAQLRALCGPVMDFLGHPERTGRRLEILVFACSSGAEVYTIASWLMMNMPDLDFHITASDLHQSMIDRCRQARYSADEALQSEYITSEFVRATFDREGEDYIVKPEIREKTTFMQANLLDAEQLNRQFEPSDIVTAQNVLFHLEPDSAKKAFRNVVSFLKPRSVLMIEGMEQDMRVELTSSYGLTPLTKDLRTIYSETRVHTPPDWWNYYWGSEPYNPLRRNKKRRYGTIFLKDA